jgi:nitric oxide reductase large subunit
MAKKMMPISSRWFQGAVVTYLLGFTVLGIPAFLVYRDQPPLPARVVAGDKTLLTCARSVKTSMPQTGRAEEQTRRVQIFAAFDLIEY